MSSPRHRAREAALRALYLWEVGRTDPARAVDTYFEAHQPDADDAVREFARALVLGTAGEVVALDAIIQRHSQHWRIERLAIIDRLILRMAIWELEHEPDLPPPVVINEALELARTFSTDDAVRFVNGVLDAVKNSR